MKKITYSSILKLLGKIESQNKSIILAIDGRCASGKSTLAEEISAQIDCNLFHMDDFFLPFERKTKERLAEPGGNVDYERFIKEVMQPLKENKPVTYRKYNCSIGSLTEALHFPKKKINIIEGVYALHPALQSLYDYKTFLTVNPSIQKERILKRNGQKMLEKFIHQWIPLEERYFTALEIEYLCDVVIDTSYI
ncbi:uridine kinase family protein [Salinibacillus xinjiangensis]|uniref:Uridine kinase n=1 Tax=Salinibacillus xinjiangensis TaxID=1229268 RepID=A0A6G1X209_9BACI|nr:uridine kinase [Salinibacillus xinjiangensis]MRG84925.1 uridine kinase [Salinibacillus xinjiangensis]